MTVRLAVVPRDWATRCRPTSLVCLVFLAVIDGEVSWIEKAPPGMCSKCFFGDTFGRVRVNQAARTEPTPYGRLELHSLRDQCCDEGCEPAMYMADGNMHAAKDASSLKRVESEYWQSTCYIS